MVFVSILAYLTGLAFACPHVFENYVETVPSNSPSFRRPKQQSFNVTRRWNEAVKGIINPAEPWPKDPASNIRTVRYCFADTKARLKLSQVVEGAVTLWVNAIGPPGKNTGHALAIDTDSHDILNTLPPYCYLEDPAPDPTQEEVDKSKWNPAVQEGTLAIHNVDGVVGGVGAAANMGFEAGRINIMTVGMGLPDSDPDAAVVVAHEFGHVFGLAHEQQRADSHKYLYFACENLNDYDEVKKKVEKDGKTMDRACQDAYTASQYGFSAHQYTTNFIDQDGYEYSFNPGPFDPKSIMLYPSAAFYDRKKRPMSVQNAPLVLWKTPSDNPPSSPTNENAEIIRKNKRISQGDIDGIKYMYPWEG